ncbi:hypothetical protein [Aquimarina hainanensis]|uniref:hypothetical protein n=1 Tax=Aquimarina hainanensis TaxID=1578017 RepID=UPI00360E168F
MSNGKATKDFALINRYGERIINAIKNSKRQTSKNILYSNREKIQLYKQNCRSNGASNPKSPKIIDLRKKQEAIEQDVSEIKEDLKVLKEKNETNLTSSQ